jgi:hypothetical protein
MNTIQLQRTISVQTFDAPATIAIGRKRPEWLAVARLAKDFGGEIRAQQITRELLVGVSPVVGNRVIERCVALGLLEQSPEERKAGVARLSKMGEDALGAGHVFVPEERNWRFYFATDPLLEQALLHIEPLDIGSAQNERNVIREERRQGRGVQDDGEQCPDCLNDAQAAAGVIHSIVEQSPSFVLITAPQRGTWADEQSVRLHLTWAQSGPPTFRLIGNIIPPQRRPDKNEKPTPPQSLSVNLALTIPERISHLKHELIWMELAAYGTNIDTQSLREWRQRAGRLVLPTNYSECTPAARNSFHKDITIPEIPSGLPGTMEHLGHFDPSKLTKVELVPRTDSDAQQWAEYKLRESLTEYATPAKLKMLAEDARQCFSFHSPSLPTPEAMFESALANPSDAKARFILAPYDLGLWS